MTALGKTEPTLSNLPVEILDKIATQLTSPKDLRAFASSCQFFREVARPLTDTLRSDPIRVFPRDFHSTLSEKIRAYTSLAGKILRTKGVAIATTTAATAAVAIGIATGKPITAAVIIAGAGAVGAIVNMIAEREATSGITGAIQGIAVAGTALTALATIGGTLALAALAAGVATLRVKTVTAILLTAASASVAAAGAAAIRGSATIREKIVQFWEEKRLYLESCSEMRSLTRAVIRKDLGFLPLAESFRAARVIYQSASPAETLRFSRALVKQLIQSSFTVTDLARFLPHHTESEINRLRLEYHKLYRSEKIAFSLHNEPSALDGDSITLQNLVLDGRELANKIARNLSPQIVQMVAECARRL